MRIGTEYEIKLVNESLNLKRFLLIKSSGIPINIVKTIMKPKI